MQSGVVCRMDMWLGSRSRCSPGSRARWIAQSLRDIGLASSAGALDPPIARRDRILGSAGCQPASLGSLPRPVPTNDLSAIIECCRQAAGNCGLAARAPQNARSSLRALFQRIQFATQKCESFSGEMEGTRDQDSARSLVRGIDGISNGWSDGVGN